MRLKRPNTTVTVEFPPVASERIRVYRAEIQSLDSRLHEFIDGFIVGAGIDVTDCDVALDLGSMVARISPKAEEKKPAEETTEQGT